MSLGMCLNYLFLLKVSKAQTHCDSVPLDPPHVFSPLVITRSCLHIKFSVQKKTQHVLLHPHQHKELPGKSATYISCDIIHIHALWIYKHVCIHCHLMASTTHFIDKKTEPHKGSIGLCCTASKL